MYRAAKFRTKLGWHVFDMAALGFAGLLAAILAFLAHEGYGPSAYKSCLGPQAVTAQSEIAAEAKATVPTAAAPAGPPPPAMKLPSSLTMSMSGNVLTLSGLVPSASTKREIIASTERALSGSVISGQLETDSNAPSAVWMQRAGDMVRLISGLRSHPELHVFDNAVRLSGTASDASERSSAGRQAANLFGPDAAIINLITVSPLLPAITDIEVNGRKVTVTGRVNSESAYQSVMDGARSAFGASHVTDRLAIDENVMPATWQRNAREIAEALKGHEEPAGIRIDGTTAVVKGTAATIAERIERGEVMQRLAGSQFTIDNRIAVIPVVAPIVDIQLAGDTLTLSGQVADEDTRSKLVRTAISAFGAGSVIDNMTVVRRTAEVEWLETASRVIAQVKSLNSPGGIRVDGSVVTLTGTVASEGHRELRRQEAQNVFGSEAAIDNQIKIKALEAPAAALEPPVSPAPAPHVETVSPPPVTVDCATIAAGAVVEFETNSTTLTQRGEIALTQIAGCLNNRSYEVAGHTDSTGNEPWNERLSFLRAKAAVTYLVTKGADKKKLSAKGMGSAVPIDTNATPGGRARNRRITFTAQP